MGRRTPIMTELVDPVLAEGVTIPKRHRKLNEKKVAPLMASIQEIGLKTPIVVREVGDDLHLIAGRHRLEAYMQLGIERIPARIMLTLDEVDSELWEISENLHRAELTPAEQVKQMARWVELVEAKHEAKAAAEAAAKPKRGAQEEGGGRNFRHGGGKSAP